MPDNTQKLLFFQTKAGPLILDHILTAIPPDSFARMNNMIKEKFRDVNDIDELYAALDQKRKEDKQTSLDYLFAGEGDGSWSTKMASHLTYQRFLTVQNDGKAPDEEQRADLRLTAYLIGMKEMVRRHDAFIPEDKRRNISQIYRSRHNTETLPFTAEQVERLTPTLEYQLRSVLGIATEINRTAIEDFKKAFGNEENVISQQYAIASGLLRLASGIREEITDEQAKTLVEEAWDGLYEMAHDLLEDGKEYQRLVNEAEAEAGRPPSSLQTYDRVTEVLRRTVEGGYESTSAALEDIKQKPHYLTLQLRDRSEAEYEEAASALVAGKEEPEAKGVEETVNRGFSNGSVRSLSRREKTAKGLSLHIGLNELDPEHYGNWQANLKAAVEDASILSQLFSQPNEYDQIDSTLLTDAAATRAAVTDFLKMAAQKLQPGDLFLLSFSGFGGQVPDLNDPTPDAFCETWCLYDGQLLENELNNLWAAFRPGVKILVIKDSCHSGKLARLPTDQIHQEIVESLENKGFRVRYMPWQKSVGIYLSNKQFYDGITADLYKGYETTSPAIKASVRQFEASASNQPAWENDHFGIFTEALIGVWDYGRFNGTYDELFNAIKMRMPEIQSPQQLRVGGVNRALDLETAFYLEKSAQFEFEQTIRSLMVAAF
jgi:hypothetical protein